MKVYTYANPFCINKAEYWDEIKNLPQLCISQTLVQGMIAYYDRTSFTIIDTIQAFLNEFYKDWESSPENDIAQYVELSDQINAIHDDNIKKSMKFNKKEIAEALKYCIELDLEPDKFKVLNGEQREFVNIYKNLKNNAVWNKLDLSVSPEKKDELDNCFRNLIVKEINKELDKKKETTLEERSEGLKKKIQELDGNMSVKRFIKTKIKKCNHLIKLNELSEFMTENKIVLHGIHQFTPIIWSMVKHLEELNVEVIFLINYCENHEKIYNTWKKTYFHLTGNFKFDKYSSKDDQPHNDLGGRIGSVLQGKREKILDNGSKFSVFDNLTSFSDYVAEIYQEADKKKNKKGGSNPLSFMSKQFYAVSSESVNDVLKTQFPDQYGEKHFLAYPVGAFILGLYNMWNSNSNQLEIDEINLKECLSVGFWKTKIKTTPLSIYDRIKLYFKNVDTLDEYLKRITNLKKNKFSIEKHKDLYELFSKMSFYNVTFEELDYFESILRDLEGISKQVFVIDAGNKVNYKNHFNNLMDIILKKSKENSDLIDKAELDLVQGIADKLSSTKDLKSVNGSVEDLKDSIHFYLSRRKDDRNNSADWIVRDFEQIDGGVLLSKDISTKTYHFALLSDKNMKGREKKVFKWPLNKEMMDGYDENHPGIDLIVTSKKEYKNFLRYSLFYGTYFLNASIELSYIENSEGEKEAPYFLLSMIGLKPNPEVIGEDFTEDNTHETNDDCVDNKINISALERKLFSICHGKYLYNSIMNNNFYYSNEYQCRYYYIIMLRLLTWEKTVGKSYEEACNTLKSTSSRLKEYLPFWNEVDFIDIEQKANDDIKNYCMEKNNNRIKAYNSEQDYIINKINFLVAGIYDEDDRYSPNIMNFKKNSDNDVRKFLSNDCVDEFNNSTDERICEYCNQRDICLNKFVEGD